MLQREEPNGIRVLSKKLINEKFDFFNKILFENKLLKPIFCFKNNKDGIVGKFRINNGQYKIYINKCIQWTEDDLNDVIIHEMIHFYIKSILNKTPIFSHGYYFRKIRKEIIKKGYNVSLNYKHLKYKKES